MLPFTVNQIVSKPITCIPLWLTMPILQKKVAIEDWDQVPRVEIAFRNNFMIGIVFIVSSISESVEIKTFHFFITYGFRFMTELPIEDWDQVPRLKIALRGDFFI